MEQPAARYWRSLLKICRGDALDSCEQEQEKPAESFRDMIARHRDANTCYLCDKPVVAGQAHHGATGAHWDCSEALTRAVEQPNPLDAIRALIGKPARTRRKREGEGATALKAKALAVAALELELGTTLFDVSVWNQQGLYRGPRWDLDCWGMYFKFEREGRTCSGQASSLATMGQCVKWRRLGVSESDLCFSYDIHQYQEGSAHGTI